MTYREEVAYIHPEHKIYIKLRISSVTVCDFFSFIPLITFHWHQEELIGCKEFPEPNYFFNRYVYIVAYFGIMLEIYWHIP